MSSIKLKIQSVNLCEISGTFTAVLPQNLPRDCFPSLTTGLGVTTLVLSLDELGTLWALLNLYGNRLNLYGNRIVMNVLRILIDLVHVLGMLIHVLGTVVHVLVHVLGNLVDVLGSLIEVLGSLIVGL